jgi:hypothetical protein
VERAGRGEIFNEQRLGMQTLKAEALSYDERRLKAAMGHDGRVARAGYSSPTIEMADAGDPRVAPTDP